MGEAYNLTERGKREAEEIIDRFAKGELLEDIAESLGLTVMEVRILVAVYNLLEDKNGRKK